MTQIFIIHQKIFDLFPETEAKTFWQTTEKNEAHFNDQDDQHIMNIKYNLVYISNIILFLLSKSKVYNEANWRKGVRF